MFNQPSESSGFFKPAEALGHLILMTQVHSIIQREDTYGGKVRMIDEATVDLVDLDGDQEVKSRVKVTHAGIVNRLVVGRTNVLGRIGQVPTDKGNPAYVLNGFNDEDVPRATAWVNAHVAGSMTQPAQTAPVAATPAAPAPAAAAAAPVAVDPTQLAALMAQLGAKAVPTA
jgi:hypothetical protein